MVTKRWIHRAAALAAVALAPNAAGGGADISSGVPAYALLESRPLPELKAALEQAGWPRGHVEAVLNAEIQRRFNPPRTWRRDELAEFEFWRTGSDAQPLPTASLRRREEEQSRGEAAVREAYAALFPPGSEAGREPELEAWEERRRWGALKSGQRAAVTAIVSRAAGARSTFLHRRGGLLRPAEWAEVRRIAATARRELAGVLTADELLDHDLRNSATAEQLRSDLDAFAPSKDEFLVVFRQRHRIEVEFAFVPAGADPGLDRQRDALAAEVEQAIATALGPGRYEDFRLSQEPACRTLMFDARFAGVPADAVRRLYRAVKAARAVPGRPETAARERLHAEFRAHFDEESTRRFLGEQGLWP